LGTNNQKYSKIEIERAIKLVQARTPSAREEPKINEVKEKINTESELEFVPEKKSFWKRLFHLS
jgi:hypothetical protein